MTQRRCKVILHVTNVLQLCTSNGSFLALQASKEVSFFLPGTVAALSSHMLSKRRQKVYWSNSLTLCLPVTDWCETSLPSALEQAAAADIGRADVQHKQPGPQQQAKGFTTAIVTQLQLPCTSQHKPKEDNMVAVWHKRQQVLWMRLLKQKTTLTDPCWYKL